MTEGSPKGGSASKPVVVITGATGNLGSSIAAALTGQYSVVGIDRSAKQADFPVFEADFTSDASVEYALHRLGDAVGHRIASVIHLVAYFDFTGNESPLYHAVNVEGTRRLLRGLQSFEVEQFVYASTMLVHAPCRPGERIDETHPLGPRWAYPSSKLAAEDMIRAERGQIPCAILRLAGVYDERSTVPTMAQQMARIYEREFESLIYSGSPLVGQAMLHREDLLDAVTRTLERRKSLPADCAMLIGEADAIGYDALQDEIGYVLHGQKDWPTIRLPKAIAVAGSWAQEKLEPIIPDAIDEGELPFIRPYMVALADDHYALDTGKARRLLGWEPRHRLKDQLAGLARSLKTDPSGWYARHGIVPPQWVETAVHLGADPGELLARHRQQVTREHRGNRWAHFVNIGLGTWLLTQPALIGVTDPLLRWSETILGVVLMISAAVALSRRMTWARWICAAIGALVMAAPIVFSTPNGAAYLSDTLVGAIIFGLAVGLKPEPGSSALAALTGPEVPPGWSYNPSAWTQRLPIIALAIVGLYVSRYLAGYQLGHTAHVWEPFFSGSASDPRNGTEEIITSSVSKAWPVSDAAVGAYTYLLEILTGIVGSRIRWRTMPWLVVLFGLMIAPLGIISIYFIIIQPIVIGTWSTLALIGAAAVLVQIPYSLDEILATLQFLRRRVRAGQNVLAVLLLGDGDEASAADRTQAAMDEFDRAPGAVLRDVLSGGVSLPWNLALSAAIGVWLMCTRMALGTEGAMADADHLIGALVLTVVSVSAAEVARPVRYLNALLGAALLATPFLYGAPFFSGALSAAAGIALILLSPRRGPVREQYAGWTRFIF